MTNEEIVKKLSLFLRNVTLEECPINIVSRNDVAKEEAELVRFVFGKDSESCVAVVYNDGTVYTPRDWQSREWDEEGWKISDERWMDYNFDHCVLLNGMPRML